MLLALACGVYSKNAHADAQGFHAYWQPTGSIAINIGHRGTVNTIAYSTVSSTSTGGTVFAVHVQPRGMLGNIEVADCTGSSLGYANLGSPAGTTALSKPSIAVDTKSNMGIVVVASLQAGAWKLYASWHAYGQQDTCLGWSEWEQIPLNSGTGSIYVGTAPSVAIDTFGSAIVQTTSPSIFETSAPAPGAWSVWNLISDHNCGNIGAFLYPTTTVVARADATHLPRIYTVLPSVFPLANVVGLVVRQVPPQFPNQVVRTGAIPTFRRLSNGALQAFQAGRADGGCAAVLADKLDGGPTALWIGCRADDDKRIYVHRVHNAVLERGYNFPNSPSCILTPGGYAALDDYTPWFPLPFNSNADGGTGHFTFASYHGNYAADVFSRPVWFSPPTTLRSFVPLDFIENAPPPPQPPLNAAPNQLDYVSGGML